MASDERLSILPGTADRVALDRRRFLSRSSLVLTAAVAGRVLPGMPRALAHSGHGESAHHLAWAVAYVDRTFVGLLGSEESGYEFRELDLDGDRMTSGARLDVDLPDSFVPSGVHGDQGSLFALGGVVVPYDHYTLEAHGAIPDGDLDGLIETDDPGPAQARVVPLYTIVPKVIEFGTSSREHDLDFGRAERGAWGIAVSMVSIGRDGHVVLVEGSGSVEASYPDEVSTAATTDGGETWRSHDVATGLGEGFGSTLVDLDGRLAAVTVDFRGTRVVHESARSPRASWRTSWAMQDRGALHAGVQHAPGTLRVFESEHHLEGEDGAVRSAVLDAHGRTSGWERLRLDGRDVLEVLPVSGHAGAWVAVTNDGEMHLVA